MNKGTTPLVKKIRFTNEQILAVSEELHPLYVVVEDNTSGSPSCWTSYPAYKEDGKHFAEVLRDLKRSVQNHIDWCENHEQSQYYTTLDVVF